MKSLDQRLHELRGLCWHEVKFDYLGNASCHKCLKHGHINDFFATPHYTDPSDRNPYWELLQDRKKHKLWNEFMAEIMETAQSEDKYTADIVLDQQKCCEAIDAFDWGK